VADVNPEMDLQSLITRYADEIRRCRYGSFRGVIKDGRVVVFAVEHEWRPSMQARRDDGPEGTGEPTG